MEAERVIAHFAQILARILAHRVSLATINLQHNELSIHLEIHLALAFLCCRWSFHVLNFLSVLLLLSLLAASSYDVPTREAKKISESRFNYLLRGGIPIFRRMHYRLELAAISVREQRRSAHRDHRPLQQQLRKPQRRGEGIDQEHF
jgi:hypothetical protein